MAKAKWKAFAHDAAKITYDAAALKKNWDRLHAGDKEPFPSAEYLTKSWKIDKAKAAALSEKLLDAWSAYHRGDFQEAMEAGIACGAPGYVVANKAQAIYANYLEDKEPAKLKHFQEVTDRAEEAQKANPQHANAFYLAAYAMGRYSQGISIVKALAQGYGGRVKAALEATLKLEPNHAEAHTAMGAYHAEIIDKVGGIVGGVTYGASKDKAVEHYQKAIKLAPNSPIAKMEYANGLLMIHGQKKALAEATKLYEAAAAIKPVDAMETLDVAAAQEELE